MSFEKLLIFVGLPTISFQFPLVAILQNVGLLCIISQDILQYDVAVKALLTVIALVNVERSFVKNDKFDGASVNIDHVGLAKSGAFFIIDQSTLQYDCAYIVPAT